MRYFQKRGKSEDDFALLLDNLVWSTSKQDVTDYIAFEQPHVWVVVHRLKLLEFMRKKIDSTVEDGASFVSSPEDALYRLYQRKGQRDVISKAKMSDILAIAMWEVPKAAP